jgi:hypothetical protein
VEETDGGSRLRQTALFDPVGATGLLYWYLFYPAHGMIFGGMLRKIGEAALSRTSAEQASPGAGVTP